MKNKYGVRLRINERKFREIVKYFCGDETATKTSKQTNVNQNTVNRIYQLLRERIVKMSLNDRLDLGEFEGDESYFEAKRIRGKRGRRAAGKTPVFGILKRGGEIYVNVVKDGSK